MTDITITLSQSQYKALAYAVLSPQDWLENVAHEMCRHAIDEIYTAEVERMTNDPEITSIPADKNQVVLDADIQSAADRQAQAENGLPA